MPMQFIDKPFTFTQPDKSQLKVLGTGNQFHATFRTLDGFTVVKDAVSGFYHYAQLSPLGDGLQSTGIRVGAADPKALGLVARIEAPGPARQALALAAPGLSRMPSRWEVRRNERRARLQSTALTSAIAPAPPQRPTTGNFVGLCLLIQFPDIAAAVQRAEVDDFCNKKGYSGFGNNGSVYDYFADVSNGNPQYGGAHAQGVAYKLAADGGFWDYEVIHSFNAVTGADTALPSLPLVDPSGNVLGVTASGGKFGSGVLYKLAAGSWKETTLHNFCNPSTGCADGADGYGPLAMDAAGNLFGTTWHSDCDQHSCDAGIVFERTAGGAYSVIGHFCGGFGCPDGDIPLGVVVDAKGNLFGTTEYGGIDDAGTVFQLSYDSGQHQWVGTTLYKFCSEQPDCTDGKTPEAPPILSSDGKLYGTTSDGGAGVGGTVFELTP